MDCISMGTNTEPYWLKADKIISKWESEGNDKMVKYWRMLRDRSLLIRDQIIKSINQYGAVRLTWDCMGRSRHAMHAHQWAEAMPEYDFEIDYDTYKCIVRRKEM